MVRKAEELTTNKDKRKQVLDIGEQRKEWLNQAATLSGSPQTEIVRILIDMHSDENIESFVARIEEYKAGMRLREVKRQIEALTAEARALEVKEGTHGRV